jgi:N-acetylmuramoyl-L-alanine amidase
MRTAHWLTLLSTSSVMAGWALAAPALPAPRVAAYPGYTRVALDVPAGATYTVEALGAALRVTFTGAIATPVTTKVGKPELSGFTLLNGSGKSVLSLATPQGVSNKSGYRLMQLEPTPGKTGFRLVVDFSGAFADVSKLTNPTPLRLPAQPMRPMTVLLDPGHGGPDSGALGTGLREDALNLSVAYRVKAWLEAVPGVRVEMTRTDNTVYSSDKRTDLNARAQASRGKTVFVSIHANAVPRSQWNAQFGTEVYYYNPSNQKPVYIPPAAPLDLPARAAFPNPAPITQSPPVETPPVTTTPDTAMPSSAEDAGATLLPVSSLDGPAYQTGSAPVEKVPDVLVSTGEADQVSEIPATVDSTSAEPLQAPLETPLTPAASSTTGTGPEQVGLPNGLILPGLNRVPASRSLAASVLSRMLYTTQASNRGVRTADFYVIKHSECPAILVEMGFVTHPVEAQQLKNANYLERTSYGIASGITAYLSNLVSAP